MEKFVYDEIYKEEDKHWWFCAKREIVLSIVQDIYQNQKAEKLDILDAGCGCGYLLRCLQEYGQVQGMDFSEEAIRYSKTHYSGPVLKGYLSRETPFAPASFHLILLLDVLEHIKEDGAALAHLKRFCVRMDAC